MHERPQYLGWVTVAFWVLAILLIVISLMTAVTITAMQREGETFIAQILQVLQVLYWVFACLFALTALLRGIDSPLGAHLTTATCIALAPLFPIGTVVFFAWFLVVRPKEQRRVPADHQIRGPE